VTPVAKASDSVLLPELEVLRVADVANMSERYEVIGDAACVSFSALDERVFGIAVRGPCASHWNNELARRVSQALGVFAAGSVRSPRMSPRRSRSHRACRARSRAHGAAEQSLASAPTGRCYGTATSAKSTPVTGASVITISSAVADVLFAAAAVPRAKPM